MPAAARRLRPFASWNYGFGFLRDHGCLSRVSSVNSPVGVFVTGRSLVQRSPIVCGVAEWDLEISTTDEAVAH